MNTQENAYRTTRGRCQRDELILENLGFVRTVLGRTIAELPSHVDKENLEAAGVLGLVEAAEHFDADKDVSFQTFAYYRIRGAILDELRRNSPLPQKMLRMIAKVRKATAALQPNATPEAVAERTGLSLADVAETLEAMRLRRMHPWDDAAHWAEELTDSREQSPAGIVESRDTQVQLAAAIERLPQNERLAVTLYYLEGLLLREIGEILGLSESRVSRLLSQAQFRLAQWMRQDESAFDSGSR